MEADDQSFTTVIITAFKKVSYLLIGCVLQEVQTYLKYFAAARKHRNDFKFMILCFREFNDFQHLMFVSDKAQSALR